MANGNTVTEQRYLRQQVLEGIGPDGQARLSQARILVVGCGGLGSPALQYLAGAGAGHLTLIDADTVEISNLHRQPLFGMPSLGQIKADAARDSLKNLNPDIHVSARQGWLNPANADDLVARHDLVLDCADSFAASYILSDRCRDRGIPLISASAIGLTGYAGVFCGAAPSLRAVFPDLPATAASCASAGVLGPVTGVLGSLQAQMALAMILNLQPPPLARLVTFDAARLAFGGFGFADAAEPAGDQLEFIDPGAIRDSDFVVDLRPESEARTKIMPGAVRRQVEDFHNAEITPPGLERTVLCCRSGLRSWRAGKLLNQYHDGEIVLVASKLSRGTPP